MCVCIYSTSVQLHQKEVPVLLKDPTSLLIQFVLTMPATMDRGRSYMNLVSCECGVLNLIVYFLSSERKLKLSLLVRNGNSHYFFSPKSTHFS